MKAYLVMVGTELLNGAIVDTNSIYMAEELNKIGVEVAGKIAVGDVQDEIINAIEFAKNTADLVILSGGLGPTIDDLTKESIGEYLKKELVVDKYHENQMKVKFGERNIPVLPKNIREVMVVEGSRVYQNDRGIAPAFFIDGIAAFPGVPVELKNMFPKFTKGLRQQFGLSRELYIRDLIVFGIPESVLEEKVKDIFEEIRYTIEFLVKDYGIIIRLLGTETDKTDIDSKIISVQERLGDNLVSTQGKSADIELAERLIELKYTIKTAESCTGGLIASTLVSVPGVSEVFIEGLVTYSNEAKMERLGVKKETLDKYGAVSSETVKEMLMGLDSDTGIAVSGVAGPGGGTREKPVGTVYIGVKVREKLKVERYEIKGERERVRIRSAYTAMFDLLNMLR